MFSAQTTDHVRSPVYQNTTQNHLKWANWQAATWRMCLKRCPNVPSLDDHGWHVTGFEIASKWLDVSAAPSTVLECVSLKCQKCAGKRCSCKESGLNCMHWCMQASGCQRTVLTPRSLARTMHCESKDDSADEWWRTCRTWSPHIGC